ncbi:MAG: urea ABC transporter ATP-binding subunit UrtE [Chloroflexi bacterium]|nr:urea ABC transporter ATP-binding subunit UrtE [Chloroflexota bacterium]
MAARIEGAAGLETHGLSIAYGHSVVVRDVSISAASGQVVCILGRNGAGKTTLFKSIIGVMGAHTGSVQLDGRDVTRTAPYQRARAGVGYVPQGRGIFPRLSVFENLQTGLEAIGGADTGQLDEVYGLFPALKEMAGRQAGVLSGGQQQQLAIGRALMGRPRLLLLDEPTEGIQPNIVEEIEAVIGSLKGTMTVLLVEQFLGFALANADQCYVMEHGSIVLSGKPTELPEARLHEALAI